MQTYRLLVSPILTQLCLYRLGVDTDLCFSCGLSNLIGNNVSASLTWIFIIGNLDLAIQTKFGEIQLVASLQTATPQTQFALP